jgi:hypothetical protein
MKSKIQFIASPGPAVNPSSDIDLFTTTLPFPVLVSLTMHLRKPSLGCHAAANDDITRAPDLALTGRMRRRVALPEADER